MLKIIDWKDINRADVGVKFQKYDGVARFNLKNVWEYRFSNSGRIFVQYRKNHKPLILLIEPNRISSIFIKQKGTKTE